MGCPPKIGFIVADYRVYMAPGEEYLISGIKYRKGCRIGIGTRRLMELGLQPGRYGVERNDDIWRIFQIEF